MLRIRIITIIFLLSIGVASFGQIKWNQDFQNYIDQYKEVAIDQMLRYRIPASITLAQGLLESGAGHSELSVKGNNHFGIKCHTWSGRTTYHDDDKRHECFRAYDSALESYEDHSKFLSASGRYSFLFNLPITDYKSWAFGLKSAGYATSPTYAYHLIEIIEAYQLYQYDTATSSSLSSSKKKKYSHEEEEASGKRSREKDNTTANLDISNHEVKICNGVYYVIARPGDTFESIANEFGLKAKKIAGYNEYPVDMQLVVGEPVFLEKKKTQADKVYAGIPHVVKNGESLHSIAQMYALRMSSLYKMNRLSQFYQPNVGDQLRVY